MFRVIRDYLFMIVGLVASIITLVLFADRLSQTLSVDGQLAVVFIACLFMWFFVENLFMKIRWGRDRRYAETLTILSDGFGEIHKLYRKETVLEDTVKACERLCDCIAEAFSLITGTKCNASIKVLARDTDSDGNRKLKAITFSRNRDRSRNPKPNPVKHWIDRNTDFLMILEKIDTPKGEYFFSNLLPLRYNYQNTSFEVYGGEPSETNAILRYWRWKLPYKSTVVVPICPCGEASSSNLVGFLCVDSRKIGAFKKDFDVPLLMGISDGIFNTVREAIRIDDSWRPD